MAPCSGKVRARMEQPLAGLKVVEVAGGLPAAYCTHLLAGYGADVVRAEGADEPAPVWQLEDDEATYLLPGKRRIEVGSAQALRELALAADIVVVDGPPARFDLAAWRRDNPGLVVVTIAPYGQTGPDRDLPADDLTAFASGGLMSLTGDPASTPLVTGGKQAFHYAGLHGFSAALGAHWGALLQGEGDWVDISVQECLAGALELYGPAAAYGEPAAMRFGNYHRAAWALYPCADGYAGVFCLERQIPSLFSVISDLTGDDGVHEPRFRDPAQRSANDEELSAHVLSFMVDRTGDELAHLGADYRIPFGKVRTPAELLESPALIERGFFDTVERPDGTKLRVPGRPFLGVTWQGGGPVPPVGGADALAAVLDAWRPT